MNCPICNSNKYTLKKYDRRKSKFRLKKFVKNNLPYFDFLIPKIFKRLKRYSSKKIDKFKGLIRVCDNCGYGYMTHPPLEKDLELYYSDNYWGARIKVEKEVLNIDYIKDLRAKYQINFILKEVEKNKLKNSLEIGAGGALASLLLRDKLRNNLIVDVCEPGTIWRKYYKKMYIHKVASYFPFKTKQKYDYIHTSHWLEHVLNLQETMNELKNVCKVGGYIFVEVPNCGYDFWTFPIIDKPHIHFFTTKSLKKLFQNNSFKCLNIAECGITYANFLKGEKLTSDKYGPHRKGFHIRAIFQRV